MQNNDFNFNELIKNNSSQPKTFYNDIFIPLLQNIFGSFAFGSFPILFYFLIKLLIGTIISLNSTIIFLWIVLSFLVFSLVYSYAAFNDDLKLKAIYLAFQLGTKFNNFNSTKVDVEPMEIQEFSTPKIQQPQQFESSKLQEIKNVLLLVKWSIENKSISQRECNKRNMTRTNWQNAINVLKNLNLLDFDPTTNVASVNNKNFDAVKSIIRKYYEES